MCQQQCRLLSSSSVAEAELTPLGDPSLGFWGAVSAPVPKGRIGVCRAFALRPVVLKGFSKPPRGFLVTWLFQGFSCLLGAAEAGVPGVRQPGQ